MAYSSAMSLLGRPPRQAGLLDCAGGLRRPRPGEPRLHALKHEHMRAPKQGHLHVHMHVGVRFEKIGDPRAPFGRSGPGPAALDGRQLS
jgi:hypothetical protein